MNGPSYISSAELVRRAATGQIAAAARLISRAEAGRTEVRAALGDVYRQAGRAYVIGVTGVPGSGKSTLVARLAAQLREDGRRVAILAIDPSSPYSGGAILGDRIRMSDLGLDRDIFIRSMATHGAVGGMSHAAFDAVDILDLAGFDIIVIETVGVGQDEVEIANASHTTVVVSAPGLGDEVQAIKAGILEIADIHVVSKCDRPDAARTVADLKLMLKDQLSPDRSWHPPVVGLSAVTGDGIADFVAALQRHRETYAGPDGDARRRAIARFRLYKISQTLLLERHRTFFERRLNGALADLAARRADPYGMATRHVAQLLRTEDDVGDD